MIVRINQVEAARAEQEADWASQGMLGPLWYSWPSDTRAFELLILEQDELQQKLGEQFRQSQLRLAIPHAIAALREAGEEVVVRLDGPFAADELLPAFRHLTESDLTGRFAISPVRKLEPSPQEVICSVRIQPSPLKCSEICLDEDLGLARSVRLRAFSIPGNLVDEVLAVEETEDARWRQILPQAGFVMSTVRRLRALQIITRRYDAGTIKSRLLQKLLAAARQA